MFSSAQTSLEYLLTYGVALILIVVFVAALAFILSSPASGVVFSSSDPSKIMLKAGAVSGTDAEIQLQNITGGDIEVTEASLAGGYSTADCTLNGEGLPSGPPGIGISAGANLVIECIDITDTGNGAISMDYMDFAGLQRNVEVTASQPGSAGMFGFD